MTIEGVKRMPPEPSITFTAAERRAFRRLVTNLMFLDMGAKLGRLDIDQRVWRDLVLRPAMELLRVAASPKELGDGE